MSRPERAIRTEAFILRRRDFGEADRLLTVLTPRYGKMDVVAKGARKPASTKTGHVELFTCSDMLIHRGRELGIVVQAETVATYPQLREDLQRGAYASYVAELMLRFTATDDTDAAVLCDLLGDTFQALCEADDPRLVVRYYEIRLLDIVGFRPELYECVISREPIQPQDQFFSYAQGGVVRPDAAAIGTALMPLHLDTLKLMRHMQRNRYVQVASLQVPLAVHNELERLMLGYITYVLEQKVQSVDFIQRVRNFRPGQGT